MSGWAGLALLAQAAEGVEADGGSGLPLTVVTYAFVFIGVAALVAFGWAPFMAYVRRREAYYEQVLGGALLLDIKPRTVSILHGVSIVVLMLLGWLLVHNVVLVLAGLLLGLVLPPMILRWLRKRRLYQLEEQLVDGIQTLTSGVRAGLNLVQAMGLLAANGVRPIRQEFAHLVREYEHGVSLEQAMLNAANRIGSPNYRLLFSALLTHRERGGDLSETLDRIADSIREIHRLEKKIETLTAPNRTAARWMAAMPVVIMIILYGIDPDGVGLLFKEDLGKLLLAFIVLMNAVGFLWIRRIVDIDI